MNQQPKVRKWLWIVLATVIVLGGGFTYWYVSGNKSTTSTKTSPTPTKSATVSPSASGSATTSTPTSEKTSTPAVTSTPTPTPQSTPPDGWKIDKNSVFRGQELNAGAHYQVFIRENWTVANGGNVLWPNSSILYGEDASCNSDTYGQQSGNCLFSVTVSKVSYGNYFYPASNNAYVVISFNDTKISAADKQIVIDSFQITQ